MSDNPVTHYLCIGCPLGCRLEVEQGGDGVSGFTTPRLRRRPSFACCLNDARRYCVNASL